MFIKTFLMPATIANKSLLLVDSDR